MRLWPSRVPADCPFPPSELFRGLAFSGRHATYTAADTWYPSWAADGRLYSPWADGDIDGQHVGCYPGDSAETGNAIIEGDDPLSLTVTALANTPGSAEPYEGRYPCATLVHDGIWYYGTYCLKGHYRGCADPTLNWWVLGPFVGFRISRDFGASWQDCPHTPLTPLFGESSLQGDEPIRIGSPHFIDFGRNMQHSPDGKAYLVAHGGSRKEDQYRPGNLTWISGDELYLLRVTPSPATINDPSAYEFFAGHDDRGEAIWSRDFSAMRPLLRWPNRMGCTTITWHPGLQRYLMCVTDGWPTNRTMNTYILESEQMTGPWRLVTYMERFGEQAYFVNFPSKFFTDEPTKCWLMYSGLFTGQLKRIPVGSSYAMVLQEVEFIRSDDMLQPDPFWHEQNIALSAQVLASSTKHGYLAGAVCDGTLADSTMNELAQWISADECEGAYIRLSWPGPHTIDRIWLFDRADKNNRILAGRLRFSDDTVIDIGALPEGAQCGLEVTFAPRKVTWVQFMVTSVSATTTAAGVSEFAVFQCKTLDDTPTEPEYAPPPGA